MGAFINNLWITYFTLYIIIVNMETKKLVFLIVGLILLALLVGGYLYFKKPAKEEGAVGAAQQATEAIPEIATNAGEEVPEVNPLDRANPFKYQNPLR